jgi:inorganic pyrophosphatase
MEVHAHTHSSRKKWTHYFWEFLMLFLAVFCGFLAEYQLEHKIEKERGMKYIRSFYEDLKTDTASFTYVIQDYEIKENAFKKIKECFDAMPLQIKSGNPCLTDLVRNSERFSDLINTDRTLQQLKNAGGLRLLKEADADSILVYDIMLRNYIRQETTGFQDIQNRMREIIYHLVNYKNLKSEKKDTSASFLYSENPELLNNFFVSLKYYSDYCLLNMQHIIEIKQKGIDLIGYFKNKYHFK